MEQVLLYYSYYACCQPQAFLFYLHTNIDFYFAPVNSYFSLVSSANTIYFTNVLHWTLLHVNMSEDIIDREQLLAAFSELGVDEVDEAVSLKI